MAANTKLQYGKVLIIDGPHRGKIGLYDDDFGDRCLVHVGIDQSFNHETCNVPESNLRNYETPAELEALKQAMRAKVKTKRYPKAAT